MESPWFSVVLWIFCLVTVGHIVTGNPAENSTDESVDEVQDPTMIVEKGESSDYRVPGYYSFNNGEPFYLEKDPTTGAVDFSKKPSESYSDTQEFSSASKQDRATAQEKADAGESEYYEDEDVSTTDQDFKEDSIDRKDGNVDGYRPNDIDKNPFKISADLYQFLNLPVHYSSSDKFPLISSSYANTKIQGTGSSSSGYSNHKYASTSSTQAPSYYTFKQSTAKPTEYFTMASSSPPPPPSIVTTQRPKITNAVSILTTKIPASSSSTTTTTTASPSPITSSTTPKPPYSEYNEGEDLVYSDYDLDYGQPQNSQSQNYPAVISTTSKSSTHVFKPTVIPIVDDYPIKIFKHNVTDQEEEDFEEDISIVTSLPVDVYYSQQTQSSTPKITSTSSAQTTTYRPTVTTTTEEISETIKSTAQVTSKSTVTTESPPSPVTTKLPATYSEMYKPTPSNNNYHFFGTKDNFEPIVDEPFRPIFGPHESSTSLVTHKPQPTHSELIPTPTTHVKPYIEYHSPSNAKPLPNHGKIEFVERIPPDDHLNKHKPPNTSKHPSSEPPRLNPTIVFTNQNSGFNEHSSGHFIKQPLQNNPLQYSNSEKQNVNGNPPLIRTPPQHDAGNRVRPQNSNQSPSGTLLSPTLPDVGSPIRSPQQNQRPPFIRLPDDVPFYVKKHSNGSVIKISQPEEIIYPHQRPVGVIPPTGLKPEAKPSNQVVKFHPPMKHDNHFIKVPIDEENPSYSLQTSFSIGLPSDSLGDKENSKKPGQGVGQVLFPDGSVDTSLLADKDKNVRPPVIRNRPPNTRPYITSYNQIDHPQQTRPQLPSSLQSQIIPQRPTSQRHPVPELRPPKPNTESYPRPHWENRSKPHIHFNPQHGPGPKPELPSPYTSVHRVKPDSNIQRPDLPNILPQFRPNAKVGSNEFSTNAANSERLREPMDILQPPPLPQPQHLRINRNDDSGLHEEEEPLKAIEDNDSTQNPIVHRRASSQTVNRVTTLQMMQQGPPRRNLIKNDFHENRPEKPVYLVYPANAGSKQQMQSETGDGVVVVGTRGVHQPVPPSNLKTPSIEKDEDDLDPFPLDDEKQFSIPTRDRVDTPILKTKSPNKSAPKNDFPYEILKPQENIVVEERIISGSSTTKEYNAFSPTASSSTEDIKDPDSEINLIPYLQDYMPFATKKPGTSKTGSIISQILNNEKNPDFIKLPSTNKPISVTLNTKLGTTWKPDISTDYPKNSKPILPPSSHENVPFNLPFDGKTTHTVSAVMQTNYAKKPVNHRPYDPSSSSATSSSVQPKPLDLEAPFQASLSAPESQGWTVVKSNSEKQKQELDKRNSETNEEKKPAEPTETKFDFDNFKPQLFGGFRPIVLSSEEKMDNKNEESTPEQSKKLLVERQEKTYR